MSLSAAHPASDDKLAALCGRDVGVLLRSLVRVACSNVSVMVGFGLEGFNCAV